MLWAP